MVLISGGEKVSDAELVKKLENVMKGGVTGIIFGRNMWQRDHKTAIAMTKQIKEMMAKYGR
jgi:class I fructose-bisphosphate aldolase